jgi:hypothetical protein
VAGDEVWFPHFEPTGKQQVCNGDTPLHPVWRKSSHNCLCSLTLRDPCCWISDQITASLCQPLLLNASLCMNIKSKHPCKLNDNSIGLHDSGYAHVAHRVWDRLKAVQFSYL